MILELELKANVHSMRRNLKSREEQALEEKQRLQQEILRHILNPKPLQATLEEAAEEDEAGESEFASTQKTVKTFDKSSILMNNESTQKQHPQNQQSKMSLYERSLQQINGKQEENRAVDCESGMSASFNERDSSDANSTVKS